ncbi:Modification methylase DsaV [Diplonema papillatum]|nr:Modification methylase DsaV [Diplonema papillatum]
MDTRQAKDDAIEPVLLLPPRLTASGYKTLERCGCIARRWHTEGRHGSRVRADPATGKMSLPLLRRRSVEDLLRRAAASAAGAPAALSELLAASGVEVGEAPAAPAKVPREEPFDAAVHAERAPSSFAADLRRFLAERKRERAGGEAQRAPVQEQATPEEKQAHERVQEQVQVQERTAARAQAQDPTERERAQERTAGRIQEQEQAQERTAERVQEQRQAQDQGERGQARERTTERAQERAAEPAPARAASFTFCELFAGIGGFGHALEALGGACVFASEIFPPSRQVYRANLRRNALPGGAVAGDIWSVPSAAIPRHDLLVGGFPCQPFSSLGDQPGLEDEKVSMGRKLSAGAVHEHAGRGQLYTQIVRILSDCRPAAFLLENVPGLLLTDSGNAFGTIVAALEGAGYMVSTEVYSSRGLTAQSRKRVYLTGLLRPENGGGDPSPFLFPFLPDLGLRAADVLHPEGELEAGLAAAGVPDEVLAGVEARPSPASLFRLSDAQMDQLLTRSRAWKPAKLAWGNTTCATLDSHYGVTVGKGNSQLVPSPAPHHPRRFTPRECARLMGFSNSFRLGAYTPSTFSKPLPGYGDFVGFNTYIKEQYHMLGNAVCPPVIAVLAGALLARCPRLEGRRDWVDAGLWAAIGLSLDSLAPSRVAAVEDRLVNEALEAA